MLALVQFAPAPRNLAAQKLIQKQLHPVIPNKAGEVKKITFFYRIVQDTSSCASRLYVLTSYSLECVWLATSSPAHHLDHGTILDYTNSAILHPHVSHSRSRSLESFADQTLCQREGSLLQRAVQQHFRAPFQEFTSTTAFPSHMVHRLPSSKSASAAFEAAPEVQSTHPCKQSLFLSLPVQEASTCSICRSVSLKR